MVMTPVLAMWFVALSAADLRTRRLPNVMTLPAAIAAVVAVVVHPSAAPGFAVAAAVYGLAFWFGACGGGDVKLAVTAGALAGSAYTALAMVVLAQVLTVAAALLARDRGPHAHGPPLCAAAALVCGIW
jgi:leader peptidase (prepilin peptidase)/N-methyltransferase